MPATKPATRALASPSGAGSTTLPSDSQAIAVLRMVMRLMDVSYRDIERQLGLSPSYLSRLFAGAIELRLQHILDITQVLGLRPDEFFRIAFPTPPDPPSVAFARLQEALAPFLRVTPPVSGAPAEGEIDLLVLKSLRKLLVPAPSEVEEFPHA